MLITFSHCAQVLSIMNDLCFISTKILQGNLAAGNRYSPCFFKILLPVKNILSLVYLKINFPAELTLKRKNMSRQILPPPPSSKLKGCPLTESDFSNTSWFLQRTVHFNQQILVFQGNLATGSRYSPWHRVRCSHNGWRMAYRTIIRSFLRI